MTLPSPYTRQRPLSAQQARQVPTSASTFVTLSTSAFFVCTDVPGPNAANDPATTPLAAHSTENSLWAEAIILNPAELRDADPFSYANREPVDEKKKRDRFVWNTLWAVVSTLCMQLPLCRD